MMRPLATLLLPFLACQALAAGTMPVADADGWRVVLCTTQGSVTVAMGADGQLVPDYAAPDCPDAPALAPMLGAAARSPSDRTIP